MKTTHNTIKEYAELAAETLVLLSKMGEYYPVPISRPSAERAWRKGRLGVRLETIFLNGKRYSSTEAINRYINRTQHTGDEELPIEPTPTMTQKEIAAGKKKHRLPASGLTHEEFFDNFLSEFWIDGGTKLDVQNRFAPLHLLQHSQ